MKCSEYIRYDAIGLSERVKNGKISPTECIASAINQIEQHNAHLNAVVTKNYEKAIESISTTDKMAPFFGVP